MTVWVDADSCPRLVRNYLIRYTKKFNIPIIFAANRQIPQPSSHLLFKMIICGEAKDSADNYITSNAEAQDIVITRDILLADRLVKKSVTVLNDRGTVYSKENIGRRLSERNLSLQFSQLGLIEHKKNNYGKEEFSKFAAGFDKEIQKLLKKAASVSEKPPQSER
ncbi:DUF188 domain-containing protein [Treponema parvum]|uniref:UPF0178 protein HRI96_03985 n=1 Tax=Treponema parvum TaxID=138851 RepID=A0A975IBX5_9SPIR|nr:DUF188 domain-containing protein [Treponema parvum]QTQ11431.1 DUF188 domain-containing protein [Treponema parvum]